MTNVEILKIAINAYEGQTALASRLSDLSGRKYVQQHIWNWLERDQKIPLDVVIHMETALREKGVEISRNKINPELYPEVA